MIGLGAYRAIREYINLRRQHADEQAFRNGYDYAAGNCLRDGCATEALVHEAWDDLVWSRRPHAFNKGMRAAISDHRALHNNVDSILLDLSKMLEPS